MHRPVDTQIPTGPLPDDLCKVTLVDIPRDKKQYCQGRGQRQHDHGSDANRQLSQEGLRCRCPLIGFADIRQIRAVSRLKCGSLEDAHDLAITEQQGRAEHVQPSAPSVFAASIAGAISGFTLTKRITSSTLGHAPRLAAL